MHSAQNQLRKIKMIAFDTETTGLLKPDLTESHFQPFITEIYLCKFDWKGKIISEFETFIKPLVPIPEEITKITGITNDMVKNAPKFIEVYDDLCEFVLNETDIFAHNCSFDIGVLAVELRRYDLDYKFPWPKNQHCTVELSFPIKNKRMALGELFKLATGKTEYNSHRAKGDVLAMVKCIVWLKEQGFLK